MFASLDPRLISTAPPGHPRRDGGFRFGGPGWAPGDGYFTLGAQRADTEVRAPGTLNLEYGAVRRFSFIRPGGAWIAGDMERSGVFRCLDRKEVGGVGWKDTQAGGLRYDAFGRPLDEVWQLDTQRADTEVHGLVGQI